MYKVLITHYSSGKMYRAGEQFEDVDRPREKSSNGLIEEIKVVKPAETKDAESLHSQPKRKPAKRKSKAQQ